MNKQIRFHIGYWVAAMIGLLVVQYVYATAQRVAPIPYSQFQQLLHDGKVAEIARSMVTRYAMSKTLGSVAYDRDPRTFLTGPDLPLPSREQDYAEQTAGAIYTEVGAIVQAAMDRALAILRERRDVLEHCARRLLEKETLDEQELAALVGPPAGPDMKVAAE